MLNIDVDRERKWEVEVGSGTDGKDALWLGLYVHGTEVGDGVGELGYIEGDGKSGALDDFGQREGDVDFVKNGKLCKDNDQYPMNRNTKTHDDSLYRPH